MKQTIQNVAASIIAVIALACVARISEYVSPSTNVQTALLIASAIAFSVIFLGSTLLRYLSILADGRKGRIVAVGAQQAAARDEMIQRAGLPLLNMLHLARDASVRYLPIPERAYEPPPADANGKLPADPRLEENRDLIINMLNDLVGVFREIAPHGTKVWASLRDRRADGNYYTFERAGTFSVSRKARSQPLNKDRSRTVIELKHSYRFGSCVVLTGSEMGESKWEPHPNDALGENLCVLMGAVMTKSPADGLRGSEWKDAKLTWIVSVNADRAAAFNDNHREIMRCGVVAFSWLANTLIRKELLANATESLV
jgi:hypothetical protein